MKLIILDRDGVINEDSDEYIKSADEFIPIKGSLAAIAQLKHADHKVVVATNQSGLARGYFTLDTLHQMHEKLNRLLQIEGSYIDGIFFCPHGPDDNCECRKPKPGLYKEIAERFNVNFDEIMVVGDSFRDIEAAMAVNAHAALVKTGKGERTLASHTEALTDIPVYESLTDFANKFLKH